MNNLEYLSFTQIDKICLKKKLILFGAGLISEKLCKRLKTKPVLIVDNSSNLWGEMQDNVQIDSPSKLESHSSGEFFIIICSTSYSEIKNQLIGYGFSDKVDFTISPLLKDILVIFQLENLTKEIIFTSGSPKIDNPSFGGGVYKLSLEADSWKYEKKFSGHTYGILKKEDHLIMTDANEGILVFDKELKLLDRFALPTGLRAHGIDFSERHNVYVIASSEQDAIIFLDSKFKVIDKVNFSYKKSRLNKAEHHCNDLHIVGDSVYVSMFSVTGNYKKEVYDGGILEIDIPSREIKNILSNNLSMPHNVKFYDDSMHVLNSLKGELLYDNFSVKGKFPAFTRGLDYDGQYYYVGQSRNRNFSKSIGLSNNISIDAGIIIFDPKTKLSRLLQVHPRMAEIHSIHVL
jgi:hypothetical protein